MSNQMNNRLTVNDEDVQCMIDNNSAMYFSPQRAKQKRRYELQKHRYIDRLCSAERRFAASDVKGVRPTIFVGDHGLSVGSRTKGLMHYGGHWKPKKYSLYTI
ncbi:uncharacterized protein RHIMIDRAFT_310696, partial [Rhizopus microsporus ATCC 52813]